MKDEAVTNTTGRRAPGILACLCGMIMAVASLGTEAHATSPAVQIGAQPETPAAWTLIHARSGGISQNVRGIATLEACTAMGQGLISHFEDINLVYGYRMHITTLCVNTADGSMVPVNEPE